MCTRGTLPNLILVFKVMVALQALPRPDLEVIKGGKSRVGGIPTEEETAEHFAVDLAVLETAELDIVQATPLEVSGMGLPLSGEMLNNSDPYRASVVQMSMLGGNYQVIREIQPLSKQLLFNNRLVFPHATALTSLSVRVPV